MGSALSRIVMFSPTCVTLARAAVISVLAQVSDDVAGIKEGSLAFFHFLTERYVITSYDEVELEKEKESLVRELYVASPPESVASPSLSGHYNSDVISHQSHGMV